MSQHWFPFNFQVHALKCCGAGGFGTMIRRMLTATFGEDLSQEYTVLGGFVAQKGPKDEHFLLRNVQPFNAGDAIAAI